jgi:hypothetical protein
MRPSRSRIGIALLLLSSAFSACSKGQDAQAAGSVSCQEVVGIVHFTPSLVDRGTMPETIKFSLTARDCSASNAYAVDLARISGSVTGGSASCTGVLNSHSARLMIDWSPKAIAPSHLTFDSAVQIVTNASGQEGFMLKGGAAVVGSFSGSDHGLLSNASVFSNEAIGSVLGSCNTTGGLPSLMITSGQIQLG